MGKLSKVGVTSTGPLVIFVPGLFGSALTDSAGMIRWGTHSVSLRALFCGCNSGAALRLPLDWPSERQAPDGLEVAGLVPLGYTQLKQWAQASRADVYFWGWDWRRSIQEAAEAFELFCGDKLSEGRKCVLVTHSTGAIVAWPTFNTHPHLFTHWVSVAGAHGSGCNGMLNLLHEGWKIGRWNILTTRTLWSFPLLHIFWPISDGEDGVEQCTHLVDINGQDLYFDMHDVANWRQHKLGPYSSGKQLAAKKEQHLHRCLATAKQYRLQHLASSQLQHPVDQYPPVTCYGSRDHDTTSKLQLQTDETGAVKLASYATVPGDGTIGEADWSKRLGGLPMRIVYTSSTHQAMCDDAELHTLIDQLCL